MINNRTIAVVIPCYNEEKQIGLVIESMPSFVDRIVIVNDKSNDATKQVILDYITKSSSNNSEIVLHDKTVQNFVENRYNYADKVCFQENINEKSKFTPSEMINTSSCTDRIILLDHLENGGVGAAIATGYKWCKDYDIDCTAVMAGDGQMDPNELEDICKPVVEENVDYVKGNRLIHRSSWLVIPKIRFFGNSILSILTKLASGYWRISDTQTGYTATSKKALNAIRIYDIYKSYGMPNDMLVKLNIAYCTLREIEIKPVYNVGEESKMKIFNVIPTVSWLLIKSFFKRLYVKYLFKDFHPLFLLYHLSFILFAVSLPYGIKITSRVVSGIDLNPLTVMAFMFLFTSAFQSLFFAMWMDMQDNERLYK